MPLRGHKLHKLTLIITPSSVGMKFPTFDKLIKKSMPQPLSEFASSLPIAAITGLVYGLDTSEGYWLRADPVDLRADINSAYFLGQQALELTLVQAQKLADSIKPLLVDLDMELFVPDPYCWFLKLKQPILLKTPPPNAMQGESIRDYLIEADPWVQRLFTEIQMVLAGNANQHGGGRAVTGLWLWGGGALSSRTDYKLVMIASDENINEHYLLSIYEDLRRKKISKLMIYTGGELIYYLTPKQVQGWLRRWI